MSDELTSVETQSQSNEIEEQTRVENPVVDEYLDAPKSYTKEYQEAFKTLSPEWRKYLTEREKQVERGFSDAYNKANSYNWVNDAYNSRQARLSQIGINKPQEYFDILARIDDGLSKDPYGTLQMLADSYGVKFGDNNADIASMRGQIRDMQQLISGQQSYLQEQQRRQANQALDDFVNAKDEAGNLKHPYLEDVKQDMIALLKSGISTTYEDAYNKAIYMNEAVRNKVIAAKSQADLNSKVVEAGKAKAAGFNPSSKTEPKIEELSDRDAIAALFDKAGL